MSNSTQNRFNILGDSQYADMDTSGPNVPDSPPKERVPPIIIAKEHSFGDIVKKCGSDCTFQRMSIGTKV